MAWQRILREEDAVNDKDVRQWQMSMMLSCQVLGQFSRYMTCNAAECKSPVLMTRFFAKMFRLQTSFSHTYEAHHKSIASLSSFLHSGCASDHKAHDQYYLSGEWQPKIFTGSPLECDTPGCKDDFWGPRSRSAHLCPLEKGSNLHLSPIWPCRRPCQGQE